MDKKYEELLKKIGCSGYHGRLGKLFKTEKCNYFLDMGTGKVAKINDNVFRLLSCIIENDDPIYAYEKLEISDRDKKAAVQEILDAIRDEHILSAPELATLTGSGKTNLDEIINDCIENVTLEVTEQCNLRCKYCIYHEDHAEYRPFGKNNMSWSVAQKAIDYLKTHSRYANHRNLGFYGGEPLMNFDIVRKSVAYAKEVFSDQIDFAITTNATMMTEEIADFMAENSFNVIVSLDGPKELHDANRVFVDGTGTFERTIAGLKKVITSYGKKGLKGKIGINIVVSGPEFDKDYERIQHFLDNEEWIPKDLMILTSSVDHGPHDSQYMKPQSKEDLDYMSDLIEPDFEWDKKHRNDKKSEKGLFTDGVMDKGMLSIHKRLLLDKPVKQYGMNGCCVPGQRRIYVTTQGKFLMCEKVGNIPSIGDVDNGLDIEKIRKLYVNDFIDNAKNYCKDCWAVNLCSLCYVNCYDEKGVRMSYRHKSCRSERKYIEDNLIRYHMILEDSPEKLIPYNDMEIV